MMIAFVIWSVIAFLFVIVGIYTWRCKTEAGFFANTAPVKMKDVQAYNHAVAKIWFVFAIGFELFGIPLLYATQNSPIFIVTVLGTVFLVIGIIITYVQIETKYRVK